VEDEVINWWQTQQCCGADRTFTSAMRVRKNSRTGEIKRARMIMHIRGEERFWHWSDQEVEQK
jgi:hypothetical protein